MTKRGHDELDVIVHDFVDAMFMLEGGEPQPARQIELWRQLRLCDVEVEVEGRSFKAHKLVLASSDFLAACLETSMSEQSGDRVVLHDMNAGIFAQVLEFLYTGKACLPESDLLHMLESAARLQLAPLIASVVRDIKETLCAANVSACWDVAQRLQLPELRELESGALTWARDHFGELAANIEDVSIELLNLLLSSPNLNCPEDKVFSAVVSWARRHNPSTDQLRKLLRHVSFSAMPTSFINDTVRTDPLMATHTDVLIDSLLGTDESRPRFAPHGERAPSLLEYTWRIPKFSTLLAQLNASDQACYSPTFSASERRWQLKLSCYTNLAGRHLGIHLLSVDPGPSPVTVNYFTLGLLRSGDRAPIAKKAQPQGMAVQDWGWPQFILCERLTPVRGFIVDDTLSVHAAIQW